jgi:hypothetical protein
MLVVRVPYSSRLLGMSVTTMFASPISSSDTPACLV